MKKLKEYSVDVWGIEIWGRKQCEKSWWNRNKHYRFM